MLHCCNVAKNALPRLPLGVSLGVWFKSPGDVGWKQSNTLSKTLDIIRSHTQSREGGWSFRVSLCAVMNVMNYKFIIIYTYHNCWRSSSWNLHLQHLWQLVVISSWCSCCHYLNPSSSQDNKTFQQLPEQIIEAGADGDYEFIRLCFLVMCQWWCPDVSVFWASLQMH